MAKLLIVDDEEKIREVVREYAEFEGYEVSEAADGREAVSLCRIEDFDLIIMDIMMPKLDGYSACKEIKKEKDIPIIMMSARGEEYDKLFGFELGIDDYVTKPFSPKELMARRPCRPEPGRSRKKRCCSRRSQIRRSHHRSRRPQCIGGRKKDRSHPERVRSFILSRGKQKYRSLPRQAAAGCLGLRFLRRRQNDRYTYQKSQK